jgi:3D (Asp-Asp-Asp) domain-containing protein
MTTTVRERQARIGAKVKFTPDNLGTGNGFDVALPRGTTLLALLPLTTTAFDGTGTVTLTITAEEPDGTTTTLVSGVDIKTTGSETVANVPKFFPNGATLHITGADQNSNSAAGQVVIDAEYTQLGVYDKTQVR